MIANPNTTDPIPRAHCVFVYPQYNSLSIVTVSLTPPSGIDGLLITASLTPSKDDTSEDGVTTNVDKSSSKISEM